jgi:chromosome condensin MukBEF ATPase and DNA-binding subunit MukB
MDQELEELLKARIARRDELMAIIAPIKERRDALAEKIAGVEAEITRLNAELKKLEQPLLHELNRSIRVLQEAVGELA